jgi:flagellar hook assembly protein FlgD
MTVVEVYNVLGQKVATLVDQQLAPGNFSARWNGTNDNGRTAASGVYFVRMHAQPTGGAAAFTQIRKIVLMK